MTRAAKTARAHRSSPGKALPSIHALLLDWYRRSARDLPWRRVRDPYAIWISETMLQQTRIETVLPYYDRFMRELPTVHALAEATIERVLWLWSGLGYYRRARLLHAAAKRVVSEYKGEIPTEPESLKRLQGVGEYTAGAIASIAFGKPAALVDGNVQRVFARLFAVDDEARSARGRARIWELAEQLMVAVKGDPGAWNQALMELGATVCVPRRPSCAACPVQVHCRAHALGLVDDLPRAAPRKAAPVVRHTAIVLVSSDAVLLARRRKEALFGGLWEAPITAEGSASLLRTLEIDPRGVQHAGKVVHILTHRRMHVEVALGALPVRQKWALPGPDYDAIEPVDVDALAGRPQSTLARKVLKVANVPVRGLPWKK